MGVVKCFRPVLRLGFAFFFFSEVGCPLELARVTMEC